MMRITEVRVSVRDDGKLKAFVSITIDGSFVIRGLKVIAGQKGLFVAMPSRRRPEGGYEDLAHPIDAETRAMMEDVILKAYDSECEMLGDPVVPPTDPPPMHRGAARKYPPDEEDGPDDTAQPPMPTFH